MGTNLAENVSDWGKAKAVIKKGGKFLRNGGAASVGEYNKIIWFY